MKLTVTSIPIESRVAWLHTRRDDVTASEVAALYGQNKYLTRLQVAYAKLYGEGPERFDAAKRRGQILEPACAAAIELDFGLPVRKVGYYLRGRSDADKNLRVGATLDYDVEVDGSKLLAALDRRKVAHEWGDFDFLDPARISIECKSVDRDIYESEWSDGPPKQHIYQAMVQAAIGGYDGALIAALVVNYAHDLHLFTVSRNAALEAKFFADVSDFWRELDDGVLPPAEARDNSIMAKHTRPVPNSVVDLRGDPTWPLMLEEREAWRAKSKAAEREIDGIEVRLKETMGDRVVALVEGWSVTWKPDKHGKRSLRIDRV